jgi:hypothetical protein
MVLPRCGQRTQQRARASIIAAVFVIALVRDTAAVSDLCIDKPAFSRSFPLVAGDFACAHRRVARSGAECSLRRGGWWTSALFKPAGLRAPSQLQ